MDEFNASKIFDIFAQVFTTANVLNTAYWPFFSAVNGHCLCVCGRFGIPCRHIKSDGHWIDMQPIAHDTCSAVFYPKRYGPILIQDYEIFIKTVDGSGHYNIGIILSLQYKENERGRLRREKAAGDTLQKNDRKKPFHVSIFSRFYTMNQYYAPFFTVMFNPSPFFFDAYGTIFKNLIQLRSKQFLSNHREHRQSWCITNSQMPSFTFIPSYVNLPVFKFPTQLYVFNHVQRKQNRMMDKSVQTDDGQNVSGIIVNHFSLNDRSSRTSLQSSAATGFNCPSSEHIAAIRNRPSWTLNLELDSSFLSKSFDNFKNDFPFLDLPSSSMNIRQDQNQPKIQLDENLYNKVPVLHASSPTPMTDSEFDEEFQLTESDIKGDIQGNDGDLDWWNIKNLTLF
ncbi:uncharacterized protein LOC130450532 [Diorhabda sublineata]|uniref:uncharacterized protein LOC130450532 n=1 Tax=Diorhabda sublineata TaxID=1163346 RepID=UPI0024E0CF89|nr:uncharacterized protein LOC130450532 [Diorhabda sublineata]